MTKAKTISLENAKQDKLFYFVGNVVIYRERDGRCLIMKRDGREKVHPDKYAMPGGKLEWADLNIAKPTRINGDVLDYEDSIEDLLRREVKEEAGIEIKDKIYFINDVSYIRPDGVPVILVKFAAKYKSGIVKLETGAFTDFAWVNIDEIKRYDCIDGMQDEVAETIKLFETL